MTRYREILRLSSLGFSNRNIALSVPCSRNTVAKVLKRAQELDISWPLEDNQTDEVLEGRLVLSKTKRPLSKAYARLRLHPQRTTPQRSK